MKLITITILHEAITNACNEFFASEFLKDDAGNIAGCLDPEALWAQSTHSLQDISADEKVLCCGTCSRAFSDGNLPRMLKLRILYPLALQRSCIQKLNEAEERCVALRTPFMTIASVWPQQQKKMKGSIINAKLSGSHPAVIAPDRHRLAFCWASFVEAIAQCKCTVAPSKASLFEANG